MSAANFEHPVRIPERLVPVSIKQDGMVVGSDGHLYPPQREPEGRAHVVALLAQTALGVTAEQADALAWKILAAVNLAGNKICTCLHVEGGTDPAHGHGYYQCDECGGLCCSERWTGHAVAGLRWMELMMQQHRHSRIVVQGLNFILERMCLGIEGIAAGVPAGPKQKRAMRDLVCRELSNLSHIWFQSSLGDYLYDVSEARDGGPAKARIYEEPVGVLGEKLAAITGGITPEAFAERFAYQDHLTPAQALARAMPKEAKERYALDAPSATCWCGHAAHLGSCACGCNAVFSSFSDRREPVPVAR